MARKNLSEAARELGRRGGLKGGPARAKTLSQERRTEIARKAGLARAAQRDRSLRELTGGASATGHPGTSYHVKKRK